MRRELSGFSKPICRPSGNTTGRWSSNVNGLLFRRRRRRTRSLRTFPCCLPALAAGLGASSGRRIPPHEAQARTATDTRRTAPRRRRGCGCTAKSVSIKRRWRAPCPSCDGALMRRAMCCGSGRAAPRAAARALPCSTRVGAVPTWASYRSRPTSSGRHPCDLRFDGPRRRKAATVGGKADVRNPIEGLRCQPRDCPSAGRGLVTDRGLRSGGSWGPSNLKRTSPVLRRHGGAPHGDHSSSSDPS